MVDDVVDGSHRMHTTTSGAKRRLGTDELQKEARERDESAPIWRDTSRVGTNESPQRTTLASARCPVINDQRFSYSGSGATLDVTVAILKSTPQYHDLEKRSLTTRWMNCNVISTRDLLP